LATAAGFAFHGELEASAASRFAATFVPFLASWWLAAWLAGSYTPGRARRWAGALRVLVAAGLAAPLASVLRAAWLGTAVVPIFVLVMGSVVGGLIVVWRQAAGFLSPSRSS
jgi:hypothetical protein